MLPLNFTNWSLGIPHVSLTINAIFIVLKRGNPVALMRKKDTPASLGKDKKNTLGQSGTVVSWTTYSGLVVVLVEGVG